MAETRLHQLGRVLRGEENPAHLLTPHNVTAGKYADRGDVVLRAWDWSGALRPSPPEKKETEQPRPDKELAGHRSLRTTMRYMHLGKGEKHRAIQMLEEGRWESPTWRYSGDEARPD